MCSAVRTSGNFALADSVARRLPDERAVTALQIVEGVDKCPAGFLPVSRTYDEDADAALCKHSGIFSKKPAHYICLSKSEGVSGWVVDALAVIGARQAAPAGYSVVAGCGRRRLCARLGRAALATPLTDVIVCSQLRAAPPGFQLAGEINGKMVCYKVSSKTADEAQQEGNDYENVLNGITPDLPRRLRAIPERPPKTNLSPLISDFNNLNFKGGKSPGYPSLEDNGSHDYEALSPSYQARPIRPAPHPPGSMGTPISMGTPVSSPPEGKPSRVKKGPAPLPRGAGNLENGNRCPVVSGYNAYTLGAYTGLEGVPFVLDARFRGVPTNWDMLQLPKVKRRTRLELDREYSYNFSVERQT